MKLCPACSAVATDEWTCQSCGWHADRMSGYPAFAPSLALGNDGFKTGYFAELAALEERNFWFRARNRLILGALNEFFPGAASFMEVGCGTGYVLSGIRCAHPEMRLCGSEIFTAGLGFAAQRANGAELVQMDAREMPFRDEFEVIGAFDVLEHIEEDEEVLGQMFAAVKYGGGVILTVPQHPFMWSPQDVAACHVRRYTRDELAGKLERAGFRVERATSFVSLLFPLMMLSRSAKRQSSDPMAELRLGRMTNAIFEVVMNFERRLVGMKFPLPFGGSLLMVGRRA